MHARRNAYLHPLMGEMRQEVREADEEHQRALAELRAFRDFPAVMSPEQQSESQALRSESSWEPLTPLSGSFVGAAQRSPSEQRCKFPRETQEADRCESKSSTAPMELAQAALLRLHNARLAELGPVPEPEKACHGSVGCSSGGGLSCRSTPRAASGHERSRASRKCFVRPPVMLNSTPVTPRSACSGGPSTPSGPVPPPPPSDPKSTGPVPCATQVRSTHPVAGHKRLSRNAGAGKSGSELSRSVSSEPPQRAGVSCISNVRCMGNV